MELQPAEIVTPWRLEAHARAMDSAMSFVLSWDLDACVGVLPWWSSTLENIVLPALDLLVAMMAEDLFSKSSIRMTSLS